MTRTKTKRPDEDPRRMAEQAQSEHERSWDGVLRREIPVTVRVLDEGERSIEVIASTEALDAHGDVVKQFWDLERYNRNGPVLWNHNLFESSPFSFGGAARPEDLLPVGKGEDVRVAGKALHAKLVLVKGSEQQEPLVDKLWRRIQQGVIRAVSIGFRPGQITRILNASGDTDHFELGSPERPNELREISFVPMGSNPEAVAKSIAWERKNLEAMPSTPEKQKETEAMNDDEKKTLDKVKADLAIAQDKLKTTEDRAEKAEKELTAEKAMTAKLSGELDTVRKTLTEATAKRTKAELDQRQSKKFAPSEREELDALVKDVGIDRVCKLVDARPDLAITEPVKTSEGDPLTKQTPPPPADGGDPSAEIVNEANKALAN